MEICCGPPVNFERDPISFTTNVISLFDIEYLMCYNRCSEGLTTTPSSTAMPLNRHTRDPYGHCFSYSNKNAPRCE